MNIPNRELETVNRHCERGCKALKVPLYIRFRARQERLDSRLSMASAKSQEQRDASGQLMKNRTADGIDVITEGHGHHQGGTDGRRGIRVRKQKQVRVPL